MPRTRKQLWRKKGRPAKPADQKLTVRITISLTPKDAEVVRRDADACNVKLSKYLRDILVYGFITQ